MKRARSPLISVIVPVYNVEKYLERCLDSILAQTYENLDIILVDDGSTDNSREICKKYTKKDSRVRAFHKSNGGLSDARNYGLNKAEGDYVVFVDSDDTLDKDGVNYLYSLIKRYNTAMSIATMSIVSAKKIISIDDNSQIEQKLSTVDALKSLLIEDKFTVSVGGKMYAKELFQHIQFPKGKLCEDNGTTYKLIMQCHEVAYGNRSVYNYYKNPNSIMTSSFNMNKLDLLEMVDNMALDVKKYYPELSDFAEKRKISARFSLLRQMYVAKLNKKEQNVADEIRRYILDRRFEIMHSSVYAKREKIALACLALGRKFYGVSWKLYSKMRYGI